ncbi:MAG: hypothetical protein MI748_04535 [Opitutales bacterium]|nr:hypothetical protein [Opitutales bacterium]
MIKDWQIQSFSRKCAVSGESFEPGDQVICLLVDNLSGELGRVDIRKDKEEELQLEGEIVGRWNRVIKPPESQNTQDKKQEVQSVEDLFVSMVESTDVEIRSNSTKCMVYILALFLERKKVLKVIKKSGIPQNFLNFRHPKMEKDFLVESIEMTPENMGHIEKNLNILEGDPSPQEALNE